MPYKETLGPSCIFVTSRFTCDNHMQMPSCPSVCDPCRNRRTGELNLLGLNRCRSFSNHRSTRRPRLRIETNPLALSELCSLSLRRRKRFCHFWRSSLPARAPYLDQEGFVLRATYALRLDNTTRIQSDAYEAANAISPHVHPTKMTRM